MKTPCLATSVLTGSRRNSNAALRRSEARGVGAVVTNWPAPSQCQLSVGAAAPDEAGCPGRTRCGQCAACRAVGAGGWGGCVPAGTGARGRATAAVAPAAVVRRARSRAVRWGGRGARGAGDAVRIVDGSELVWRPGRGGQTSTSTRIHTQHASSVVTGQEGRVPA